MTGNDFRRHLGFVRRLVREHRLPDDVADGEDVRHVRALLPVDGDEAALVDHDARGLALQALAIRRAADRNEHLVVQLRRGGLLALERDPEALAERLDAGDPGAQHHGLVPGRDALLERAHEVAIAAGHQAVRQFDDTDLHTEGGVHRRHLEPDDAAAHDEHALRQVELERAGGVDDARIVGQARQPQRLGTRGDDAMREGHALAVTVCASHVDGMGVGKPRDATDDGDLALLGQAGEARRQAPHHLVLPVAQPGSVDLRLAELDAMRSHRTRVLDDLCRMQQRLGRNAADVEAHAAKRRPALDQRHLEAEIRRAKRRGVSPGARTDDEHVVIETGR